MGSTEKVEELPMIEKALSNQLIRAFYNVHDAHGHGFLESVYSNSLAIELEYMGLSIRREVPVTIHHRGKPVGMYRMDLLLEEKILVEVKSALKLAEADQRQLLNYLKATPYEIGFLMNFGPKAAFLRRLLTNDRKHLGLPA